MPAMTSARANSPSAPASPPTNGTSSDFEACQEGVAQGRGRARPGRRAGQQCRHHPRHDDEADGPPEVAGGDRHQPRRLLQHGQGGVRGHASAAATGGSSTSARSTARPANTARSIMPPPSPASTASPRRWRRKARAPASPSTPSRRAISTPTWSPRCREEVLGKIVAKIPVNRLGQAERDRARRRLPGRRECRLRHRLDAVDQRRPAHVLMEPAVTRRRQNGRC